MMWVGVSKYTENICNGAEGRVLGLCQKKYTFPTTMSTVTLESGGGEAKKTFTIPLEVANMSGTLKV